jgi:hypothetical protein
MWSICQPGGLRRQPSSHMPRRENAVVLAALDNDSTSPAGRSRPF